MTSPLANMSSREKVLAGIVAGVVFLLFNLVLLNLVTRRQTALRADIATAQTELAAMQTLLAEHALWLERDAWLTSKQPPLANESAAGVQLLDHVRNLAATHGLTLENPAIAPAGKTQYYRSVAITVETKSLWPALVGFLHALQTPDQCVVLENANIQIDPADNTKIKGRFKIARWYAP